MQPCVGSGQCATRGPKWSRCVPHVGMAAREACVYVPAIYRNGQLVKDTRSIHHAGRLIKRTITHMREGLVGWYVTTDPFVCDGFIRVG
jgi:hypothetical protein